MVLVKDRSTPYEELQKVTSWRQGSYIMVAIVGFIALRYVQLAAELYMDAWLCENTYICILLVCMNNKDG